MTCNYIEQLLEAYFDNELSPEITKTVDEHVRQCLSCRKELESYRRLKELLLLNSTQFPKEEYWQENKNIILARTVESEQKKTEIIELYGDKKDKIKAFRHAIVSVAASLLIFMISVVIGTSSQNQQFTENLDAIPVLTKIELGPDTDNIENGVYVQQVNEIRIKRMMMLSTPGMIGRAPLFRDSNIF